MWCMSPLPTSLMKIGMSSAYFSEAGALTQAPKFPLKIYSICFYFFVVVGQTKSIGQEKLYDTHFICFDEIIFPFCFCSIKLESFQNPCPFFCCKK